MRSCPAVRIRALINWVSRVGEVESRCAAFLDRSPLRRPQVTPVRGRRSFTHAGDGAPTLIICSMAGNEDREGFLATLQPAMSGSGGPERGSPVMVTPRGKRSQHGINAACVACGWTQHICPCPWVASCSIGVGNIRRNHPRLLRRSQRPRTLDRRKQLIYVSRLILRPNRA